MRIRRINADMSKPKVLSPKLHEQLTALRDILKSGLRLSENLSDQESAAILRERMAHLQAAALFVVVGEVKSGKSSFVNALLGEEVCEVAPDPCTAGIQELVYGDEPGRITLGDFWERVALPREVLREITIVDTPGTNSLISHHQTITEKYLPFSDLVIFVFPAKNPHTATPWTLLTLIRKEWRRKVVFVLQQADLASRHELVTNQERVKQYARERDVQNPIVFSLSAKREGEGASDSGFAEFRDFLRQAVETGEVWRMKLEGGRDTAGRIAGQQLTLLRREEEASAGDGAFYVELMGKLEARRAKAQVLQRLVVESLAAAYDRLCASLEEEFAEGLGIGNVLKRAIPLLRDKDFRTWLKDLQRQFENRAKAEIEAESQRVSKDLSAEMQGMLDELVQALSRRPREHEDAPLSRISVRTEILERLTSRLKELRLSDIAGEQGVAGSDLGTLSLAGGGMAALGALIALSTNLMVFDLTGGILAAAGVGVVAVALLWKRTDVLRDFRRRMAMSRAELRERLQQEISRMFEKLFLEIEHQLKEPLVRLEKQRERLASLIGEAEEIRSRIDAL
jgi:ribosome biogenesis GTPase A